MSKSRVTSVLALMVAIVFFTATAAAAPPEAGKAGAKEKPKKEKVEKGEKAAKPAGGEKAVEKAKKPKEPKEAKKEEGKKEKPKDPKKVAKGLFDEGKAKFEAGDFQGALEKFLLANETLPNPFVYLKIADCYEKLGNLVEAASWLEKYLAEVPDAANVKEIQAKVATLKWTPGKVVAVSTPEGAKIILDEKDTGKVTPAEVEVVPGTHTITFELEGYIPHTQTFEMTPGGAQEIEVELAVMEEPKELIPEEYPEEAPVSPEPAEEAPEEAVKPVKVNHGVWASAGVAAAGIVSATVFGILALNKEAEFEDEKDKGRRAGETEAEYEGRLSDIKDKGEMFALICDISWGVGAAATLTGIILYYVTQPKKEKKEKEEKVGKLTVGPLFTGSGSGAVIGVRF